MHKYKQTNSVEQIQESKVLGSLPNRCPLTLGRPTNQPGTDNCISIRWTSRRWYSPQYDPVTQYRREKLGAV